MDNAPIILCVDDEPTVLDALKTQLKSYFSNQYIIETAESGEEALEIIEEIIEEDNQIIPVVLCDYIMPKMKGDELIIEIHKKYPQINKVLLTGQADVNAVANVINQAKLYRYIAKPWDIEDLGLTLEGAIKSYFLNIQLAKQQDMLAEMVEELQKSNENLEQKVLERTQEVQNQKEEIESSYKNLVLLSEIGKQLNSSLSLHQVIRNIYENISSLMPIDVFIIGIHHKENNSIDFVSAKVDGKELPIHSNSLEDEHLTGIFSFKHKRNLLMNDYVNDYPKIVSDKQIPTFSEKTPQSVIYIPLLVKEKAIGILSVHSYQKNAYTDYHFNFLDNLALYIASALENAQMYETVEEQKHIVEQKNNDILDSISYAKRIQSAIIPSIEKLQNYLPNSFVFLEPRDIVSGDFYWFYQQENHILLVAADCTGHGIPGAFMSIIGNNLLTEVVQNQGILTPNQILEELDKGIQTVLKQEEGASADGMDIAICLLKQDIQELEFAGANNPLILIQDGELTQIKGNKYSAGGVYREIEKKFDNHSFDLSQNKETSFFIYSDGFQDQFGGELGKKYMVRNFRNFLHQIHQEDIEKQHFLLEEELMKWKGSLEQVDDILVIGVKISQ